MLEKAASFHVLRQAPGMAYLENTERGPRVLRAFSLARVVQERMFPGFGETTTCRK